LLQGCKNVAHGTTWVFFVLSAAGRQRSKSVRRIRCESEPVVPKPEKKKRAQRRCRMRRASHGRLCHPPIQGLRLCLFSHSLSGGGARPDVLTCDCVSRSSLNMVSSGGPVPPGRGSYVAVITGVSRFPGPCRFPGGPPKPRHEGGRSFGNVLGPRRTVCPCGRGRWMEPGGGGGTAMRTFTWGGVFSGRGAGWPGHGATAVSVARAPAGLWRWNGGVDTCRAGVQRGEVGP